jgi:hypothetical protein
MVTRTAVCIALAYFSGYCAAEPETGYNFKGRAIESGEDVYAVLDYVGFVLGVVLIAWMLKLAQDQNQYASSKRNDDADGVPVQPESEEAVKPTKKAETKNQWQQVTEDSCSTLVSYVDSGTKGNSKNDPIQWKFIKER